MREMDLSIIIPCFNEEGNINEMCGRLSGVCNSMAGLSYEIVLVNDGSTDGTWNRITELSKKHAEVTAVNLSRNYGHQLALSAGLSLCVGGRILIIDADLQDPPELLPEMMQIMDSGYDVVYGKRIKRQGETWLKKVAAKIFYRLLDFLSDIHIHNDTGDFRLINQKVLKALNSMPEANRFIRGMISWVGFRQAPIMYEREKRHSGETHYPFPKMLRLAIDAITGFSMKPLRTAFFFGLFSAFLGLIFLIYAFYTWITEKVVPGWTSIVSIILIMNSTQFILLGLMGEYIGRIFIESKRRPNYFIDEIIKGGEKITK